MNNDKKINIICVGTGYHARRIYLQFLMKEENDFNIKLVAGYDILSQKNIIDHYFLKNNFEVEMRYTENSIISDSLEDKEEKDLIELISKYDIKAAIISTEPLAHFKYAKFFLDNNISILMDKPITTELGVVINSTKAKKLLSDYDLLNQLYISKKKFNPDLCFHLMAQRRYHPAFLLMKKLIEEVQMETNCPITSLQSFHSDGQWRFPTEIVEQTYHPYNQGYGKCSHSGYHSIDISSWLIDTISDQSKKINNVTIDSTFIKPNDLLAQLNLNDYKKLFPDFDKYNKYSTKELKEKMVNFGEVDAFINISFKHDDDIITNASINLLHNGFGQRSWVSSEKRDLYKGNGRVRHESHLIEQGPFQSISFISYQSNEVDPTVENDIYGVGGEYHLDIHVFRNSALFPKWKSHQVYHINKLNENKMQGFSRGHQEDARRNGIVDFIKRLKNEITDKEVTSDFSSHRKGIILVSGIYQSGISKLNNNGEDINMEYKDL